MRVDSIAILKRYRHTRLKQVCRKTLTSEEQRVERNGLGKRHANNGLHQDFAGCPGVAANGFNGFITNNGNTNGGGSAANGTLQCVVNITFDLGEYFDHFLLCVDVLIRFALPGTR